MSENPFFYHPGGSVTLGKKGPLSVNKSGGLVVFVLDESGSMGGTAIQNLNTAVNRFASEIVKRDAKFSNSIEMLVIAFNSKPRRVLNWTPLGSFRSGSVNLAANGGTTIGSALDLAFKELEQKEGTINRADYTNFVSYIVLVSDGYGGAVDSQARKISALTQKGGFQFWMLGVKGYDEATAKKLTAAGPERLYTLDDGSKFDFSAFFNGLIGGITGPGPGDGPSSLPGMNKRRFTV